MLQCKAHPEAFPSISVGSPSLLMVFFLCSAKRNACANYSNLFFFFCKPSNKHLFLNTGFDFVCGSSSGYRLVTGVVKLMKSLLLNNNRNMAKGEVEFEWK